MPPYTLAASRGGLGASYVVCAMFTPGYRDKADRLVASLRALDLEYAIYETPAVHCSISPSGAGDIQLSKPGFIDFVLCQFEKPVLYVDADMVFRQAPLLLDSLRDDFAICNWLANDATDAWVPVAGQETRRYWTFSHAIDDWSITQMICSGCVQWWAPSAHALLDRWRDVIAANPGVPDDHALDVAFNQFPPGDLRVKWLPKEYARYAFWIFTNPVIDHPEFPAQISGDFHAMPGTRTIASRIITHAGKTVPLPRSMLIDTQAGLVLARDGEGQYVPWAPLQMPLYLPPA
jgi:hypothetical protein